MTDKSDRKSNSQERGTRAKGVFPRQPLSKVLDLPRAIFQLGQGEPVRRLTVFDALDRSPSGGSSRALIAAANSGYGLIQGSAGTEYLSLTEDGLDIMRARREPDRYAAIYRVLFGNGIFSDFIEHFKDRTLPIDEVAIDYLRTSHALSESDAASAWDVFKLNIQEYGLAQELSGKSVLVTQEVALEAIGYVGIAAEEGQETEPASPEQPGRTSKEPRLAARRQATPQIVFNIQVVLPEDASAEDYDNIFESIGKHLLGGVE